MSFTPVVKKSIPTRTITCIVWTCVLLGCTLSMHLLCPLYYEPNHWHIRAFLLPWMPMVSIAIIMFGCAFGMGDAAETIGPNTGVVVTAIKVFDNPLPPPLLRLMSVEASSWYKIGIYNGIILVFYFLFSLPMSYIKHYKLDFDMVEQLE